MYASKNDFTLERFTLRTTERTNIEDNVITKYYDILDNYNGTSSIEYEADSIDIQKLMEYMKTLELMFRYCNIHTSASI